MPAELIPRRIAARAAEFIGSFRVVILNGPRQSGKTTLLQQLNQEFQGSYVSLDEGALRAAARADPAVFISGGSRPMMIDEIQRGGDDLVLAIKAAVDSDSSRGQFILAGSTRFLSTPSLSESLAGRAGILEIWPFAEQEVAGQSAVSFISRAYEDPMALRSMRPSDLTRHDYFGLICRGGYPEPSAMESALARHEWYRAYVEAVVDTDIREMARVEAPGNLDRLLHLAAASTSQEFNILKAASDLQLHRTTVSSYLSLLETVFLIRYLPAFSHNPTARVIRRPKLHVTDTGLAAHLLGVDEDGLAARVAPDRGALVESFIVNELARQATWSPFPVRLQHWRVSQGPEVDLVVERGNGRIIGIEAKATDAISLDDFNGLAALRDRLDQAGGEFVHGFALYTGHRALSFGDRLTALPVSALWM